MKPRNKRTIDKHQRRHERMLGNSDLPHLHTRLVLQLQFPDEHIGCGAWIVSGSGLAFRLGFIPLQEDVAPPLLWQHVFSLDVSYTFYSCSALVLWSQAEQIYYLWPHSCFPSSLWTVMQKEGDLILFCCSFALAYILSVLAEREGALWSFPEVIKALFLYTDWLYKVRLHTVGSRWFSITP